MVYVYKKLEIAGFLVTVERYIKFCFHENSFEGRIFFYLKRVSHVFTQNFSPASLLTLTQFKLPMGYTRLRAQHLFGVFVILLMVPNHVDSG